MNLLEKIYFIPIFTFLFTFSLSADAFFVSFFNNGKENVSKIVASPAGKGEWKVLSETEVGPSGTAKLNGSGPYGNWDFKIVTSSGAAFLKTINPWLNQSLSTSQMSPTDSEIAGSGDTVEYSVRIKNLTGKTLVTLAIGPTGTGDLQEVKLNNIGNNGTANIKIKAPANTTDWDIAVISSDGSSYAQQNVDIKQVIKFTKDNFIEVEPDKGNY